MRLLSLTQRLAPMLVFAPLALAQIRPGIVSLATLHDRARPLLVFAPKLDDPRLQTQLRLLSENAAAIAERDLVVIAIPYQGPAPTATTLAVDDPPAARGHFRINPNDFTVILIGKDGGEKFRAHQPLSIAQLTAIIDAMPMRQQEMRSHPQP